MATKKSPKKATKRPRILKKGAKATKAARVAYRKGMKIPHGYIWTGGKYLVQTKWLEPIGSRTSDATQKAIAENKDLVYGKKGKKKDKGALERMAKLGNVYRMTGGKGDVAVDFSKDVKMSKALNEAGTGKKKPTASNIRQQQALGLTPKEAQKRLKRGHNVVFFGPDGHTR